MPADENCPLSCSAGFVPHVRSQFGFDLVSALAARVVRDLRGDGGREGVHRYHLQGQPGIGETSSLGDLAGSTLQGGGDTAGASPTRR